MRKNLRRENILFAWVLLHRYARLPLDGTRSRVCVQGEAAGRGRTGCKQDKKRILLALLCSYTLIGSKDEAIILLNSLDKFREGFDVDLG